MPDDTSLPRYDPMGENELTTTDERILVALEALAVPAAASIGDVVSFVHNGCDVSQSKLQEELAVLFERGLLCRNSTDDCYSLTPRGKWELDTIRYKRAADAYSPGATKHR